MLEKACCQADTTMIDPSTPGQDQSSPATPEKQIATSQPLPLTASHDPRDMETRTAGSSPAPVKLETDTTLGQAVNAPVTTLSSQNTDDENLGVDNDMGTDIGPNYTTVIQQGNTERRTSRVTRITSIPHCSLLIQVKQFLVQCNNTLELNFAAMDGGLPSRSLLLPFASRLYPDLLVVFGELVRVFGN